MKKVLSTIAMLMIFCGSLFAGNPRLNPATPKERDGTLTYTGDITWHKKVQTGSDSTYTYLTDDAVLVGASDTLYSDCYRVKNMTSLQPVLSGGTTVEVCIVIQAANAGASYPAALDDSLFANSYWLVRGTGMVNCYANTVADTITTTLQSTPIYIPLLRCDLFRIMAYTTSSQSGNTAIRIPALLKEK